MKIKTDRCWQLETKVDRDCMDITEFHDGTLDTGPYIVIPIEAVDEIVFQLLQFKRRYHRG